MNPDQSSFASNYRLTRPTRAGINLNALHHNYNLVQDLAGQSKVMAVVKAEAYGHGLVRMAQEFSDLGADYLAVSFLEEGILLREAGLKTPILVLGGLVDEQIKLYLEFNLDITVSSIWKARQVNAIASQQQLAGRVHLKIDTGMGRIGQNWNTAKPFFEEVARLEHLAVIGLYTHLATADESDLTFAHQQLERFRKTLQLAKRAGLQPVLIHAANSGALMQLGQQALFSMVRPGIMLYGWSPSSVLDGRIPLQPVMTLKSVVVYVKKPPSGSTIGYGATWSSPGERWIATLPVGYGDGFPITANQQGEVMLRSRRCPIVGRVSMDQITIDAGPEVYLGDEVVLFGGEGANYISLWELATRTNTIPYQILCGLTSRVPRIYVKG